jgi:glycosyltransferase involved in cell wall biosynthesis
MCKILKVLHVISNFGIGGAEVWLIALLKFYRDHAAQLGIQVQIDVFLTNGFEDRLDGEAEALGARLIYARYSRKTLPAFIATWRRTLAEGNYDAVHDHQEFTAGFHFLFGLGQLPPVRIAHLHNPMSHQVSYSTTYLRRKTIATGNWLVAKHATHLLSTSRQLITEQGFDDLPSARDLKKEAIHCGFDPERFLGDRKLSRHEISLEFNLQASDKVMLFVGRLDSNADDALNQKNPSFCLEVAKACAERDPNFVCLIAGGGDGVLAILRERVRQWRLSSRIHLLGARPDVPQLMQGADLLLFPSLAEGLGMVAVEAQAAGLPVIASDAVPRECQVVEGMVDFLPLSAGVNHWAGAVLHRLQTAKPDHLAANQSVMDSPFSIENSARSLLKIYSGREISPCEI